MKPTDSSNKKQSPLRQSFRTDAVPSFYSKRRTGDISELTVKKEEPTVIFDPARDVYLIEGESNLLYAREFFTEIMVWLSIYGKIAIQDKALHIRLYDFNASSALYLSKVFELWVKLHPNNEVVWHYRPDDEWERESGEIFKDIISTQFSLIDDPQMPYRKQTQ
jgi:hypothetical protein